MQRYSDGVGGDKKNGIDACDRYDQYNQFGPEIIANERKFLLTKLDLTYN